MSNKLIVAAAGSGKTTFLINEALCDNISKILITTFTEANEKEIRKKFYSEIGYIPQNVTIQTWFSFLIKNGIKPYQSVIFECKVNGVNLVNVKSGLRFKTKNGIPIYYGEDDPKKYYFDNNNAIYSDKISKFAVRANEKTFGLIIQRLEKIFDKIFIDEIQDMAGYDLELIKLLFRSKCDILLVGDPRQVTYHTHEEGKYKKYKEGDIVGFVSNECKNDSVEIDTHSLNTTYRNNKIICDYANSIYPNYNPCNCIDHNVTGHDGVFFISPQNIDEYLQRFSPMQLRDTIKTKVNYDYPYMNFGESKGLTFGRVLIYPTKPMLEWITDKKPLKPQSQSKLYVAITRAQDSVAIVYDNKTNKTVNGIENYYIK